MHILYMPGFTAEASIYKTSRYYRLSVGSADSPFSHVDPAQFIRRPPPDLDSCPPSCGPCRPDPTSSFGCSRQCNDESCATYTLPCRTIECGVTCEPCMQQCTDPKGNSYMRRCGSPGV